MAVILAIEDHDEVLTMVSMIFERHHMLLAPDSTSEIRRAKDLKPDLILLDVGMPDIEGLDVSHSARGRGHGLHPHHPRHGAHRGRGGSRCLAWRGRRRGDPEAVLPGAPGGGG
ncbi:MAG: response regulator [Chloroflexi bacterium]|nr:response regulator [Chloroflexota bacterium]